MNWIVVKKFPLETDLSAITGYLRQRGIVHQIYEEQGGQTVAVTDPAIVEPLLHFITGVTQGKIHIDPRLNTPAVAPSDNISFLEQIKAVPVTSVLILLSVIGASIVALNNDQHYVYWFTFQGFTQREAIPLGVSLAAGEWWRILTPVFLHFGFFHVLFNCMWLWELGRRIEILLGKIVFLIFFMSVGILSNTAQYVWSGPEVFGGMSGVVYALVGFIMISQKLAPHRLTAIAPGIIIFMLVWLVLCMTGVIDYFIGGSIANAAHLGGLLAGCAFAVVTTKIFKIARVSA